MNFGAKRILFFLILFIPILIVSFLLSLMFVAGLGLEVIDHKPYSGSGPVEYELNPPVWPLALIFILLLNYLSYKIIVRN